MIKYLIRNPTKWHELELFRFMHSFGTSYDNQIFGFLENPTNEKNFIRSLKPIERDIYNSLENIYYNDDNELRDECYLFAENIMRKTAKDVLQNALLDIDKVDIFDMLENVKKQCESILDDSIVEKVNHFESWRKEMQRKIDGDFPIIESKILTNVPLIPSELTVIGARTSMGKTSLALCVLLELISDYKVLFISAEMPVIRILDRLTSYDTNIDNRRVTMGRLNQIELDLCLNSIDKFENNDNLELAYSDNIRMIKRLISNSDCELVVIDYLQLIKSDSNEERRLKIAEMSRDLKRLSVSKDIPVITLAQLNRDSTKTGDKRPTLVSLAESGAIEQDANNIVFIHRPSYYLSDEIKKTLDEADLEETELIIAKQRDGIRTTEKCKFINGRFYPIENAKDDDYFTNQKYDATVQSNTNNDIDFDVF